VLDTDILSWLEDAEPVKTTTFKDRTNTLTTPDAIGLSFEISREVLLHLMEKAITVVPTRDFIPVLTNFQFKLTANQLTVIGSSMEMSVVVSTDDVNVKVAGTQVFPAKLLLSIVKEADAGSTVFIEVTNTGAAIVAGSYSADIKLPQGKDYLTMDDISEVVFYPAVRNEFLQSLNAVKYALPGKDYSGQDSMRMINIKGGKFTACDGSRFQQVRINGFKLHMQLPTFSINTILKILSSTDQEIIEIGETANRLVFKFSNVIFYLDKMNDPYPNVEQLWLRPALTNDIEFIINRDLLITAIKQVRLTSDNDYNAITLELEETQVTISSRNINNSTKVVVECTWAGKPTTIVVNYLHLAEMLKAYPDNECRFLLAENTKTYKPPILLKNDTSIATIAQLLNFRS